MPVAIYLRVSTEEQRERQSIETQREFAERYCALHQLAVFRVYADDGVSGTVPIELRQEGSQILVDARNRRFDQLLVYKLDRLGRDTRLILNAVADLETLGVRVRSMTEEFDTGTPTGRLMLTLLSGFASHEREVFRERSVAGIRRLAETGAWLGGIVPYGYRRMGEKREAHLVISTDPIPGMAISEADVIRDIFRMATVERKSCHRIARRLNELRIPCAYVRDDRLVLQGKRRVRTAGVWHPGRIRAIVTNTTYKGIHEFGKRTESNRPVISRAGTGHHKRGDMGEGPGESQSPLSLQCAQRQDQILVARHDQMRPLRFELCGWYLRSIQREARILLSVQCRPLTIHRIDAREVFHQSGQWRCLGTAGLV